MHIHILIWSIGVLAAFGNDIEFKNSLQDRTLILDYETEEEFSMNLEELTSENVTFTYNFADPVQDCVLSNPSLQGTPLAPAAVIFEQNAYLHLTSQFLYVLSLRQGSTVGRISIYAKDNLEKPLSSSMLKIEAVGTNLISKAVSYNNSLLIIGNHNVLFYELGNSVAIKVVDRVWLSSERIKDVVLINQVLFVLLETGLNFLDLELEDPQSIKNVSEITVNNRVIALNETQTIRRCEDTIYLVFRRSIVFAQYNFDENTFQVLDELELGFEIIQLEISQRAVWILTKDHLYEYIVYDNATDLRESRVLILNKLPTNEKVGKYQIIPAAQNADSKYFGLFEQTSKTVFLIRHSKSQNFDSADMYMQKISSLEQMYQVAFDGEMTHLYTVSDFKVWHGRLSYSPASIYCAGSPGRDIKLAIEAKGLFCRAEVYNFTNFKNTKSAERNGSSSEYLYSDELYYNPDKSCTRQLIISLKFIWPTFLLVLMGIGLTVLVGCFCFSVMSMISNIKRKNPSGPHRLAEDSVFSPSAMGLKTEKSNIIERRSTEQPNLSQMVELGPTVVTKRGTGDLSFGPDEMELAQQIQGARKDKFEP